METLKALQEKLIVSLRYGSEHLVKYRLEKILTLTSRGLYHR